MSLFQRVLRWRIARHDARAKAFAAATVAAQLSGDARNAARFQEQMHHAQALRDGLLAHADDSWSVTTLPGGDFIVTRP